MQLEYALLATATARIALGQFDDARAVMAKEASRLPASRGDEPWFRYQTMLLQQQLNRKAAAP